jgi:hypothetical protein
LFDRACVPLAVPCTKGAWLARRRLMAIDATSFDVADTEANVERFDRLGSGPKASAYPKLHVAALAECGSHAIVAAKLGSCRTGERTLVKDLASRVEAGMLVLADAHGLQAPASSLMSGHRISRLATYRLIFWVGSCRASARRYRSRRSSNAAAAASSVSGCGPSHTARS